MTLFIIWLSCFGFNIICTLIDVMIVNKKFSATLGDILLLIIFMGIFSPVGSLLYIIAYIGKYNEKTIINWEKNKK